MRPAASSARRCCERAATLFEEHTARAGGALRARGRQDAARRHRRSARGRGFPALLRGARAPRFLARGRAARSHRRAQPAAPARQGCVRLHQPVEFSAGYLHGPGGRGAGRRQHRGRQARRTDAADGGLRHRAAAAGGRAARSAAVRAGRWREVGARADARSAPRGRGIHRIHGNRAAHRTFDGGAARRHRHADRRDRRAQRDAGRQLGAAPSSWCSTSCSRDSTARGSAARRCACCSCRRRSRRACRRCWPAAWTRWCSAIRRGSPPTSGPVIDDDALAMLEKHARADRARARAGVIARRHAANCAKAASSRRSPWRSIAGRAASAKCSARWCTWCVIARAISMRWSPR